MVQIMKIEDSHSIKLRQIQNMVFTISTFLIAIGIQGLLPLPFEWAWFFIFSGNLAIYWVAWSQEKRKLMFLTVVMFIAQSTNIARYYFWG